MKMQRPNLALFITALALWLHSESARAAEFESLKNSLIALLQTPKVVKKTAQVGGTEAVLFYAKGPNGKPQRAAFIEKGIYEPNCTHTWAIGIEPASGKVTQVRVIEMSCPHAYPTNKANFLGQYRGKGPADVQKLDSTVQTIAKATGSSQLTTTAVKHAITAWQQMKGSL